MGGRKRCGGIPITVRLQNRLSNEVGPTIQHVHVVYTWWHCETGSMEWWTCEGLHAHRRRPELHLCQEALGYDRTDEPTRLSCYYVTPDGLSITSV